MMRFRFSFLFVALLASAFLVAAQSTRLVGDFLDESGNPVHARIEVIRNDGTRPRTVMQTVETDQQGNFQLVFNRIGTFLLRVHADGTQSPVNPEVRFFANLPGTYEVELVADARSVQTRLELRYSDSSSIAARMSDILATSSSETIVDTSEDVEVHHALMIRTLYDAFMNGPTLQKKDLASEVLSTIPPESPVWLATGDLYLILRTIDGTVTPEKYADFAEAYIFGQSDPYAIAGSVFELMGRARLALDTSRVNRYLGYLEKNAPDSQWTERARMEFSDKRAFKPGKPVPDFQFPKLQTDGYWRPKDVQDTVYLLDFWAVWCGPCVAERGELKTIYDSYHDDGFEIISVSFDFSRETVDLNRWSMPWKHAFCDPNEPYTDEVRTIFALSALPKLVLVDRDGRIIMGGIEVRPKHVEEYLAKTFGH